MGHVRRGSTSRYELQVDDPSQNTWNAIKEQTHATEEGLNTFLQGCKGNYLEDTLKNVEDQTLINSQASALLQNMPVVKSGDFFSVFVPQSWFFSIGNSVRSTTELVFDSVVVKAMYIDLNFNTKNILLGSNSAAKKNPSKKNDIFDVLNFESFKELSGFAEKIKNLKKISTEYNSMRSLEDSNNVANHC